MGNLFDPSSDASVCMFDVVVVSICLYLCLLRQFLLFQFSYSSITIDVILCLTMLELDNRHILNVHINTYTIHINVITTRIKSAASNETIYIVQHGLKCPLFKSLLNHSWHKIKNNKTTTTTTAAATRWNRIPHQYSSKPVDPTLEPYNAYSIVERTKTKICQKNGAEK